MPVSSINLFDILPNIRDDHRIIFIRATTQDGEVYSSGHWTGGYRSRYDGQTFGVPVEAGSEVLVTLSTNPEDITLFKGTLVTKIEASSTHKIFTEDDTPVSNVSTINGIRLVRELSKISGGDHCKENHGPTLVDLKFWSTGYSLIHKATEVVNVSSLFGELTGIHFFEEF